MTRPPEQRSLVNVQMFVPMLVAASKDFPDLEICCTLQNGRFIIGIPKGMEGDFLEALLKRIEELCLAEEVE